MRGAKPPAIIFVWPSPTRVGAAEDEVMEVMIYWGSGTAPASQTLSSSDPTPLIVPPLFYCERTVHSGVISISIFSCPDIPISTAVPTHGVTRH